MYLFDTSSLIYAWDTYPQNVDMFHPFWIWLEQRLQDGVFVVPDTTRNELKKPSAEMKRWLDSLGFDYLAKNEQVLTCAAEIKRQWIGEQEYGGGVKANDLLIISAAKVHSLTLVTNEAKQLKLPDEKRKYKIPALCSMSYVDIPCLSFVELIKNMN